MRLTDQFDRGNYKLISTITLASRLAEQFDLNEWKRAHIERLKEVWARRRTHATYQEGLEVYVVWSN